MFDRTRTSRIISVAATSDLIDAILDDKED